MPYPLKGASKIFMQKSFDKLLGLSDKDRNAMLRTIGISNQHELFSDIPDTARIPLKRIPAEQDEHTLLREIHSRIRDDANAISHTSYLGYGCYEHQVPTVIDSIVSRGEFLTAYTPYQPEMSQGILAAIDEFQTEISKITNLPVVTCSHYDGATALAEAAVMACRAKRKDSVMVDVNLSPAYLTVIENYCFGRNIKIVEIDLSDGDALEKLSNKFSKIAGIVCQTPNYRGDSTNISNFQRLATKLDAVRIISSSPDFMPALNFDVSEICDVLTMEGQPLGLYMFAGGAHIGILACCSELRNFVPGRIVGSVTDVRGNKALALVFEDREQHVARDRATSNICSNQALNAIRVGLFLKLTGLAGLENRLVKSLKLAQAFLSGLRLIPDIKCPRNLSFQEFVIKFNDRDTLIEVKRKALEKNIFLGVCNSSCPKLDPTELLVCITETKDLEDLGTLLILLANHFGNDSKDCLDAMRQSWDEVDVQKRTAHSSLLGETETSLVRRYTAYTRNNFGVDTGSYPLGSCTMKYNPKRNDAIVEVREFRWVHPCQPPGSFRGLISILEELRVYLSDILGLPCVDLTPAAGAHGELKGLLIAKRYFEEKHQSSRKFVIVPESAHGTNPATASMMGYEVITIPSDMTGNMDLEKFKSVLSEEVAVVMMTNPSTLGVFDSGVSDIIDLTHRYGALAYFDGANMNALMGFSSPGAMGFDIAHINVHKTLSTPHGGGGPGSGPVAVKKELEKYVSSGWTDSGVGYNKTSIKLFSGHVSVLLRAYSYIRSMGRDGLQQASADAVLNANYLMHRLAHILPPAFDRSCMHEFVVDGSRMTANPVDVSKRLIDFNIHPPTLVGAGCVYYGDGLKQAMLFEPTETESKEELDHLVSTIETIIKESQDDGMKLLNAPLTTKIRRVVTTSGVEN
jgi:glycine cleavage system protein P-like pyridoxal-binding family